MKRLKNLTIYVMATMVMTLAFGSCKKDTNQKTTNLYNESDFGKYSKELVITDAEGENSAVLLVGSNDKSYLDLWTEKNFELIPVKYDENTKDVLDEFYGHTKQIESPMEENEGEIDTGKEIFTMFLAKNLTDDVEKVLLYEKAPETGEKGWKYETHYSGALDAGGTLTCYVYGANFWHWGYYGLQWRSSINQDWATIVSEWRQVGRNDTYTHSKTKCFQMKARRKYTGSPESVTIEFNL